MKKLLILFCVLGLHLGLYAQWDTINGTVVRASASSTEVPGFQMGYQMLGHFFAQQYIPRTASIRVSAGWAYYENNVYAGSDVSLFPVNSTRQRKRSVFVKINKEPMWLVTNNAHATYSFGPHLGYRMRYFASTYEEMDVEIDTARYNLNRLCFDEYTIGLTLNRRRGMTAIVAASNSTSDSMTVDAVWYNFFNWSVHADLLFTKFRSGWARPNWDRGGIRTKWTTDDYSFSTIGLRLTWEMQLQLHKKSKKGKHFWCFTGRVMLQWTDYTNKFTSDLFILPGISYCYRSNRYLRAAMRRDQRIRIKAER